MLDSLTYGLTIWTASPQLCATADSRYNLTMPVFDEKQEELEHYETMMGVPRGRLAVTMDMITDAMALGGQHGVYCQSEPWPRNPVIDNQWVILNLDIHDRLARPALAGQAG